MVADASPPVADDSSLAAKKESSQGLTPWRWGAALLVVAAAAWAVLNFNPLQFQFPPELSDLDQFNPVELERAAAAQAEWHWKNTLATLGLAGLCFGAATLLSTPLSHLRERLIPITGGLIFGIICGLLAAAVGIAVRAFFDTGAGSSMLEPGSRTMVPDLVVYVAASVLLVLPVTPAVLVSGERQKGQKIVAIPVAGVAAGLLLPLIASFVLPAAQTDAFPPEGLWLTALWFVLLAGLVFFFTSMIGSRQQATRVEAERAEGTA